MPTNFFMFLQMVRLNERSSGVFSLLCRTRGKPEYKLPNYFSIFQGESFAIEIPAELLQRAGFQGKSIHTYRNGQAATKNLYSYSKFKKVKRKQEVVLPRQTNRR